MQILQQTFRRDQEQPLSESPMQNRQKMKINCIETKYHSHHLHHIRGGTGLIHGIVKNLPSSARKGESRASEKKTYWSIRGKSPTANFLQPRDQVKKDTSKPMTSYFSYLRHTTSIRGAASHKVVQWIHLTKVKPLLTVINSSELSFKLY